MDRDRLLSQPSFLSGWPGLFPRLWLWEHFVTSLVGTNGRSSRFTHARAAGAQGLGLGCIQMDETLYLLEMKILSDTCG